MTRITFDNVSKSYDRVQPLSSVSFSIEPGEFFVLVGPSGSGKSTLLRMIAGLESITDGRLLFDDVVMNDVEPRLRDVGMVFQNYALYPHLTVAENLAFPLTIRRTDRDHIRKRVGDVAELLSITPLLDRRPKQLSGGQRQRVAVGRAIVRKPKVFLFDEPLSNLDALLRVEMRTELRRLQRELGITTVYVTHDQVEAMTMADRMAILHNGHLQQLATPTTVYTAPATTFVATFCGSPAMNIMAAPPTTTAAAFLGVRPEDLHIATLPTDDTIATGTVVNMEFIGHEWLTYVDVDATPVVVRTTDRPTTDLGATIALTSLPERRHYFDASGARLA